jgi:putative transposase
MDKPYTLRYTRRNLPHWLVADHSYFVTLRLKGTLPKHVVEELREQRQVLKDAEAVEEQVLRLARKQFASIERVLDSLSDVQWLRSSAAAQVVWEGFDWLREKGWVIFAGVIMPNHVHLLMRNTEGRTQDLLNNLARFKSYTARKINEILGRSGSLWAREVFDHWIRGREKFEGTVRYIVNNPVRAGLVRRWSEWSWLVVDDSVRYCLGDEDSGASA